MNSLKTGIFFSLLLTFIILAGIIPLRAFAAEPLEYVKVGIKTGEKGSNQCMFFSDSGFSLGFVGESGFTETLPLPAYTTLIASVSNGHISLRDSDDVLLSADIGKNGCLIPFKDKRENFITIDNNNRYRGGIMLRVNSLGFMDIVNYLDIEEYLYGVVHLEMNQGYPLEALKAQAVAARSFALINMGRHRDEGFDLCSDTHCQVYGGVSAEQEKTNTAVDQTRGLAIYWEGKPASANYHKNSGGHTQNASDVWTTNLPYLTGKEDPYTPDYPWTATIHFDSLLQKLIQSGYNPGLIKAVEIKGRGSTGAVTDLKIIGEKGDVTLKKEQIRSVLGANIIRSRFFNIGEVYHGGIMNDIMTVSINVTNGKRISRAVNTLYAISAGGKLKPVKNTDVYISDGQRIVKPSKSPDNVNKFDEPVATGGKLILSGIGSGHGVGMSQDGAIEMARQGLTFSDILLFYYTGIEVR